MGLTTDSRRIVRYAPTTSAARPDALAVEAPLTVMLNGQALVTTMRTPGHDLELTAGWLVNESAVRAADDIVTMGAFTATSSADIDTVHVSLATHVEPPRPRSFVTNAACGVCSSDLLTAVRPPSQPLHTAGWALEPSAVHESLHQMRSQQRAFDRTGALHAAAIAEANGDVRWVREDVGRHNAVDKAVGRALLDDLLPLTNHLLVVSGRVSFEIVHKAITAGVAAIVAVSGPTTLAVDLAREHGLVLIGFARDGHFNVYAGDEWVHQRGAA